jgi:16S rRNA pseudouridine516 synthase
MESRRTRLDRFLKQALQLNGTQTKTLLAQKRIRLNGRVADSGQGVVNQFTWVQLDGETLQKRDAVYIALNKPVGIVSATLDAEHSTVVDLIDHPQASDLHLAGRLDKNSTGLVLLTNDGTWSRALSSPSSKVQKTYQVTLANPLREEMKQAFAAGMYFATEGITTLPARLEITGSHTATVVLSEGKYHQIKRMFGRFRNPVLAIHRSQIGSLTLDESLSEGSWRLLTVDDLKNLAAPYEYIAEPI